MGSDLELGDSEVTVRIPPRHGFTIDSTQRNSSNMVDIGESRKDTTAETFRLPVYDEWHNSRIALSVCTTTCDPIHAIALSADGRFLAIGNDGGNVEVRALCYELRSNSKWILGTLYWARIGKIEGFHDRSGNSQSSLAPFKPTSSFYRMWKWQHLFAGVRFSRGK